MPQKLLASLGIVALFAAGCLGFAPKDRMIDPIVVESAIAEYVAQGGQRFSLSLEDPVRILDRDGSRRLAYPLTLRSSDAPDQPVVFYLDGEFRVVRADAPCLNKVEGRCEYADIKWGAQGLLPPFGAGLLVHLRLNDTIPYSEWNRPLTVTPQLTSREDGKLQVGINGYARSYRGGSYLELNGEFIFGPRDFFPERFSQPNGTDGYRVGSRTSYHRLGPLGPAEVWPKLANYPHPREREGMMFRGESGDDMGSGFTHRAALDWLLQNSEPARLAVEGGGCVTAFLHDPNPDPPPEFPPWGTDVTSYEFTIVTSKGEENVWTFHRQDNWLGSEYGNLRLVASRPTADDCHRGLQPGQEVSSGEFVVSTQAMHLRHTGRFGFAFMLGTPAGPPLLPEKVWDSYEMIYRPAFVDSQAGGTQSYRPYLVSMDANHGWWTYMQIHPEDRARIDRGE